MGLEQFVQSFALFLSECYYSLSTFQCFFVFFFGFIYLWYPVHAVMCFSVEKIIVQLERLVINLMTRTKTCRAGPAFWLLTGLNDCSHITAAVKTAGEL